MAPLDGSDFVLLTLNHNLAHVPIFARVLASKSENPDSETDYVFEVPQDWDPGQNGCGISYMYNEEKVWILRNDTTGHCAFKFLCFGM